MLGATGFLGQHVCKRLGRSGASFHGASRALGTDICNSDATIALFREVKPRAVINCAAFVGGISYGMTYPADLFQKNMLMSLNILEACRINKVETLVNPISNCTYPGEAKIFRESEYWDGPLHESVLAYGTARKALTVASWAYAVQHKLNCINLIMSNMFGPGDHYDEHRSHAAGALVKKIVDAHMQRSPHVSVWGTGSPVREWLYVEDAADALVKAIDIRCTDPIVNLGSGNGISIRDLASLIAEIVGYRGALIYDASKPDGARHKTVDGALGRTKLGWEPSTTLRDGLVMAVNDYQRRVIKNEDRM